MCHAAKAITNFFELFIIVVSLRYISVFLHDTPIVTKPTNRIGCQPKTYGVRSLWCGTGNNTETRCFDKITPVIRFQLILMDRHGITISHDMLVTHSRVPVSGFSHRSLSRSEYELRAILDSYIHP